MDILKKIKNKIYVSWNPWFREHFICRYYKDKLNNQDISIFCNNCVGAVMAHDLGLQFKSPFVNLWLYPKDYIKFCENINHYINCSLIFITPCEQKISYPVAKLDDITIYFQHYHTNEEARQCWEKRKKRINKNAIRCILIERDGCTKEDLIRFSKLPYPTASLVHLPMPDIKDTHYIRGFENNNELGDTIPYRIGQYLGYRYYDDFDFVKFFNN